MPVPAKLKQMVGKSSRPTTVEVEKGHIRRLAAAIGEDNPIHFDEAAAKAAGFSSIVGTPTLPATLFDLGPLLEKLEIDLRSTQHWEEQYEYFLPICAGDVITVSHKVADIYDKQAPNGRLIFVVIETRGNDHKGRKVFKGRRVLVELKH